MREFESWVRIRGHPSTSVDYRVTRSKLVTMLELAIPGLNFTLCLDRFRYNKYTVPMEVKITEVSSVIELLHALMQRERAMDEWVEDRFSNPDGEGAWRGLNLRLGESGQIYAKSLGYKTNSGNVFWHNLSEKEKKRVLRRYYSVDDDRCPEVTRLGTLIYEELWRKYNSQTHRKEHQITAGDLLSYLSFLEKIPGGNYTIS